MGIQDRDYMKRRPPDYEPEHGHPEFSGLSDRDDAKAAKLTKRITTIFACIVIGTIVITIIALAIGK